MREQGDDHAERPLDVGGPEDLRCENPYNPKYPGESVRTDCGSHTHTVLPERDRLIIYVAVMWPSAPGAICATTRRTRGHDKISIVEVPRYNTAVVPYEC